MPGLSQITGKMSEKSDAFGDAALAALEQSQILHDCVAMKDKRLPEKGEEASNLLTLDQLREIAVTIMTGIRRNPRISDKEQCGQEETQQELRERLVEFFDIFLPACLPNYQVLNRREGLGRNVQTDRAVNYACHPQVMRLMANAWARWRFDRNQKPERLAGVIGGIYLRMADPDNVLERDWKTVTDGTNKRFQNLRHESWEKATTEILRLAAQDETQDETQE